jgi:hypothetical protein
MRCSDILHDESNKTGHKIEDIPKRAQVCEVSAVGQCDLGAPHTRVLFYLQEFLNQLPDPVRGQIEQMFAQLANPAGTPAAAGGAAAGPSKPAAADSDSDDDDDSDSDSDSDDKQQPKSAITPGKAGAAAAAKPASAQKPSTATKPKPAAPAAAPSSQPKADKVWGSGVDKHLLMCDDHAQARFGAALAQQILVHIGCHNMAALLVPLQPKEGKEKDKKEKKEKKEKKHKWVQLY